MPSVPLVHLVREARCEQVSPAAGQRVASRTVHICVRGQGGLSSGYTRIAASCLLELRGPLLEAKGEEQYKEDADAAKTSSVRAQQQQCRHHRWRAMSNGHVWAAKRRDLAGIGGRAFNELSCYCVRSLIHLRLPETTGTMLATPRETARTTVAAA